MNRRLAVSRSLLEAECELLAIARELDTMKQMIDTLETTGRAQQCVVDSLACDVYDLDALILACDDIDAMLAECVA